MAACNLGGVVHSWSKWGSALWDEARRLGKGTDWVNQYPLNLIVADKLAGRVIPGMRLLHEVHLKHHEHRSTNAPWDIVETLTQGDLSETVTLDCSCERLGGSGNDS